MRNSHDPCDFAAPSPIVPTSRTHQSNKARPFYNMSASTARHISSMANGDTDSKPLRLLGIISDGQQYPENPHKDDDVADLIRCLQSPSAATVTSTTSASAAASASATSLLTTASGSGAREMLKAGHRRLRQLAQRQRKDFDTRSKTDDDARQLSALHREGLLPSPAPSVSPAATASTGALRRSPAKRKSAESSPAHPAHPTHHQSNSRRDVERIGQPWLADPLERCMLDSLSSSGRLSSLDLGDLATFMDTAILDEPESKSKPQPKPQSQLQSQPQSQPQPQPKPQSQPQPLPELQQQPVEQSTSTEPHATKQDKQDKTEKTDKDKARPHLKLFPDPLPPPRISSKAARRLSKCPAAQPASLPPLTEIPSPPKQVDREQPVLPDREQSAPSEKESAPSERAQSPRAEDNEQLPMHAIKALFPLPAPTRPAPTRPLPAVPESAVPESARANPRKNGLSSPSSDSQRQSPVPHTSPVQSPVPLQSPVQRQSPVPQTSRCSGTSHLQVIDSEPQRRPRPFSFEASGGESEKRQSVDFDHSHNHNLNLKARPQSPSAASSPPTLASPRPLNWQTKRSSPSLAPDTHPGSQIRRSNSACGRVHRSEYPIPSSDEEGLGMRKQKRASPPHKKHHRRSKLSTAKPAPLSPTRDVRHRFGGSSPLSQYSDVHPVDSHVHVLQSRIAHLERQNKVLQAALLAALDAGNKDTSDFMLAPGPAPAPAPVSRITPPSSLTTSASSMDEPEPELEPEPRDDRRDTWLDLDTRSRSSSSAQSFDFSATDRALEGIHDVDFGWLSDRSSFVH